MILNTWLNEHKIQNIDSQTKKHCALGPGLASFASNIYERRDSQNWLLPALWLLRLLWLVAEPAIKKKPSRKPQNDLQSRPQPEEIKNENASLRWIRFSPSMKWRRSLFFPTSSFRDEVSGSATDAKVPVYRVHRKRYAFAPDTFTGEACAGSMYTVSINTIRHLKIVPKNSKSNW